jgi:hypothetical protein
MPKIVEYRSYSGEVQELDIIDEDDFPGGRNNQSSNFAIAMQKISKDKGKTPFYLEIGSSHYRDQNNTYVLEKEHGWSGISIDIEKSLVKDFIENRKNICICEDALSINWDKVLEENNAPKTIDFLQIDVDITPWDANLIALLNLPLTRYRFNSIVIEHSVGMDYTFERLRSVQRYILSSMGYRLVNSGHSDDWWVDATVYEMMQTIQITDLDLA